MLWALLLALCLAWGAYASPILYLEDRPLLSLEEVIDYTLEYQWSIQTSWLTIKAQQGVLEQATGAFNPLLTSEATRLFQRDIQNPPGNKTDFNGRTTNTALGLQALTRLGTTYAVNFTNDNIRNPTIIPSPQDSTNVNFSFNQPLLRNLLYSPQTTLEETQRLQLKTVRLLNVQNIANAIFSSVVAYWQFVAAIYLLEIQRDLEMRFCEIARYADALVKEGQQGFTAAYQPHADLNQATANRIQAEQNLKAAYNTLLFNMGFIPDENQQVPDFEVQNFPDFKAYLGLDGKWYDDLLVMIPFNRSDIMAADLLIEIADLNLTSAKNSMLPALDVVGEANFLNTAAKQHAKHVFDSTEARNPEKDYTVGLTFSFPLYNDTAKGLTRQNRALKSQAIVNKDLLVSQIVSSFKTAYTASNALLEEIKKNTLAAEEYRKTVEAEKIKLENGLSTYFVVLTLENNWLSVLISLINSEAQFIENVLQLRLLSGTLIKWKREGEKIKGVEDVLSYPVLSISPTHPVEDFIEERCKVSPEE